VSHCGLAIYIKNILRPKKRNYRNSNISPCKQQNLQKSPLKETKILQKYHNSIITNLKFQHKPKYHLSKIQNHVQLGMGVCQNVALQFTLKKKYLKAKEELWKLWKP
jgi:hypothetical protein